MESCVEEKMHIIGLLLLYEPGYFSPTTTKTNWTVPFFLTKDLHSTKTAMREHKTLPWVMNHYSNDRPLFIWSKTIEHIVMVITSFLSYSVYWLHRHSFSALSPLFQSVHCLLFSVITSYFQLKFTQWTEFEFFVQ